MSFGKARVWACDADCRCLARNLGGHRAYAICEWGFPLIINSNSQRALKNKSRTPANIPPPLCSRGVDANIDGLIASGGLFCIFWTTCDGTLNFRFIFGFFTDGARAC